MNSNKYAIIDIETTGGKFSQDRIIEIAVAVHDGEKVIETFDTLINPELSIPYHITRLTGINNEMVKDAPRFFEVAKRIVELTEDAIFVAHNVRFDYSFIKEEFKSLGYTFSKKQLCTVRLSRNAFPGLKSYSLGNLIKHFGIKVNDRHRALADTLATVTLFEKILLSEHTGLSLLNMLNLGIKESLLPRGISIEDLHKLPEEAGVYYMLDDKQNIVYIGKSINIKKRIVQHFTKATEKAYKLQRLVHEIDFVKTGSELAALLNESLEIKKHQPRLNRAQKAKVFPYAVYKTIDENGYINFEVLKYSTTRNKEKQLVGQFPKLMSARRRLENLIQKHQLCLQLCHLEHKSPPCFNYHLKQCYGACLKIEHIDEYNSRALLAEKELGVIFKEDFILMDAGRDINERFVTLVQGGVYRGHGYVYQKDGATIEDVLESIQYYPSNGELTRIVATFIAENPIVKKISI